RRFVLPPRNVWPIRSPARSGSGSPRTRKARGIDPMPRAVRFRDPNSGAGALGLRLLVEDRIDREFDVDAERRDALAAIQLDLHLVALDRDVLGDHVQDLFAQGDDQVGPSVLHALVREDQLQALAGDRARATGFEEGQNTHAALRVNSLLIRDLRSEGIAIGTVSPLRRRTASM